MQKLFQIVCFKGNIIIAFKGADAINASLNRNDDFPSLPVLIEYQTFATFSKNQVFSLKGMICIANFGPISENLLMLILIFIKVLLYKNHI
jgi:hypothetical protein